MGGKSKDPGNEVEFVNGNDFQILYSDELMFNYDALSAVPIQNYIHKNDFTIFALSSHSGTLISRNFKQGVISAYYIITKVILAF